VKYIEASIIKRKIGLKNASLYIRWAEICPESAMDILLKGMDAGAQPAGALTAKLGEQTVSNSKFAAAATVSTELPAAISQDSSNEVQVSSREYKRTAAAASTASKGFERVLILVTDMCMHRTTWRAGNEVPESPEIK
jgi:hypothetical protein